MLESIKRWFSGRPGAAVGEQAVAGWAAAAGHSFKRTRDGEGFVVDAGPALAGWRLEWGASQRSYIEGRELRLRAELNGGNALQMLVLSRRLKETLERRVFEQYTEGLQTRIDTDAPEEMRWLVLYAKSSASQNKDLREHFGAVSSAPPALAQWLAGDLTTQLLAARAGWLGPDDALALVVQRGRLTLRHPLPRPDAARVADVLRLFEVALAAGRRVAGLWDAPGAPGPSTRSDPWNGSVADSQDPPAGP